MNYTASDVRKRRIERGSGNTSSSSGGVTADDVKSRRMSRQFGFDTLGADEANVRSLISNTYGNWQDKDTLNANYAQVQGIANRLNAFKQYNGQNVKSQTDLDKIINFYNGALENWDAMAQTYGNFINADAYNAAVKKSDLQRKYAGKSYEQIQQALGKAEDKDEYNYLLRYTDYANKEDIEKAIAGTQNVDYKRALTAASEQYDREHAFDKYAGILNAPDYVERDGEDARKAISKLSAFMKAGGNTGDTSFSDVFNALNEDERSVAGYIYNKEGIDGVMNYLRDMQFYAGKRKYNEELENATEGINSNNWKAFGQTVGNALTNIVSLPYVATEELDAFLTGGQYNPYIGASGAYNFSQDTTQAVAQKIADNTNWEIAGENVPAFLYNVAMSDVNSRLGQILTGQAFTMLMGAGAFSSTYKEALERGLDSDNAAWTALTAGISESLFEYVSFEQFKALQASGNVKGIRDIVANFAKQFFTEGSEEVATDIANRLSDDIINGSLSEYNSRKQAYIDAGYSKEEAEKNANAEFGKQLAESFIAGGLAGGVSSGVASILSYTNNMKTGRNADREMLKAYAEANGQGDLLDQADTNAKVGAFINDMREENRGVGEWSRVDADAFTENAGKLSGTKKEAYEENYKGQDAEKYDDAFNFVWDNAQQAITLAETKAMFSGELFMNQHDIEKIYAASARVRTEEGAMRVQARKEALAMAQAEFKRGSFESSVDVTKLSQERLVGYRLGEMLSAIGANFEVIDDAVGDNNGFFVIEGDKVVLNLSAKYSKKSEATGEFAISTIAHEMTHYGQKHNVEGYSVLRDTIMKHFGDTRFSNMIAARQQELEIAYEEAKRKAEAEGKELDGVEKPTRENAEAEVIAHACEDMLNDPQTFQDILNRMSEKEIKSVRDFIMKVFDTIKETWSKMMEGFASGSREARVLRDIEGAYEEARQKWVDMIADALKSAQVDSVGNTSLIEGVSRDNATIIGATTMQFSHQTYENGGREMLQKMLTRNLSEKDAKDTLDAMDLIYEKSKTLAEGNTRYNAWQSTKAQKDVFDKWLSVIVNNGDYPYNIDFSTVCKKRKALDKVLNAMVQNQVFSDYIPSPECLTELISEIKTHGFEVACALCFVDAKRYRVGEWAKQFTDGKIEEGKKNWGWNELIRTMEVNGYVSDEYNFTDRKIDKVKGKLISEATTEELEKAGAFKEIDKVLKTYGNRTSTYRMAKAIRQNSYKTSNSTRKVSTNDLRKRLHPAEIISSLGLSAMRSINPELFEIVNAAGGTSAPKLSLTELAYNNEIAREYESKNASNQKDMVKNLKKVGGYRLQSFSDYMANMVFDYMQLFSDFTAMGYPVHAYTKEYYFVKLFGLMGAKINMSIVPDAVSADVHERFGAFNSNLIKKNPDAKWYYDHAGMAECSKAEADYSDERDGKTYYWKYITVDECFPVDKAFELQADKEYGKNCGIIWVGVSDAHIRAMLADDRIAQVIPYHSSGINPIVKHLRKIDWYNDYTNYQNPIDNKTGKKLDDQRKKVFDERWNLYDALSEAEAMTDKQRGGLSVPQYAAEMYKQVCKEMNVTPAFSKFADEPNYYKLLADFRLIDAEGNYAPQNPVKFKLPGDWQKLMGDSLKEAKKLDNDFDAEQKALYNIAVGVVEKYKGIEGSTKLFSKQIDTENIPAEKYEEMKSHFGTTINFNVAGYLLKDGKMLDFSGRHWGDTSSMFRQVDHRDIQEVLVDKNGMNGIGSMITMISNGNIRLMPENGGINLSEMPNEAQMKVLERYIRNRLSHEDKIVTVDFDEKGGDTVYSKYYEAGAGVSAQSIIRDIIDYYENGIGSQSTVAQFHNMYSKQVDEEYLKAVESGDEETQRRIIDQAAKGAGYNVRAYHGTTSDYFTIFNTYEVNNNMGSHFGSKEIAEGFATGDFKHTTRKGIVYDVYLKAQNPFKTYDWFAQDDYYPAYEAVQLAKQINTPEAYAIVDQIKGLSQEMAEAISDIDNLEEGYLDNEEDVKVLYGGLRRLLELGGYDSILYENGLEIVGEMDYIIQKAEQIKSADLVTYDDQGKVILPSKRFNTNSPDIRYSKQVSDSEYAEAVKANDMKLASQMVKAAAERAGFNSPMLFHGTKKFGFTRFDLNMMDDKQSIFLTDSLDVAKSYSSTYGVRAIVGREIDYENASTQEIADAYNELNGNNYEYKVYSKDDARKFIEEEKKSLAWSVQQAEHFYNEFEQISKVIKMPGNVKPLFKKMADALNAYAKNPTRDTFNAANEVLTDAATTLDDNVWRMVMIAIDLYGFDNKKFIIEATAIVNSDKEYVAHNKELHSAITREDLIERLKEDIADRDREGLGNYGLYARLGNMLTIVCDEQNWDGIEIDKATAKKLDIEAGYYKTRDIADAAKRAGYDSVKLENLTDVGDDADGMDMSDVYVIFNPASVKSADAVTYDDAGKMIPLSERFSDSTDDIRYSKQVDDEAYSLMGEADRLAKDNQKLRKDVERLTEALRLSKTVTNGKVLKKSQVEAAARTIRRIANSTYDVDVLTNELTDVYSYILDNANDENKAVDWDVLMGMAYDVAGRVLHESKGAKYVDAHYKAMLNEFRNTRVSLSDEQIQKAKNAYGDDYRNAFMGSIILAKNATPLDTMWQEWSAQYPELFDADTNPGDMPTALLDAIDTIRESATVYESFETQEMTTQLAYEIYNKFWNVDTVRTYADRALAQHRKAMAELKASYEERLARRLAQQKLKDNKNKAEMLRKVREQRDRRLEEFKEFKKKQAIDAKEAQAKRTMIRKIIDTSAELNKWLTTNSKDKHVPEALKVPLANLLDAIDFSSKQMYNTGVPTRRDISLINAMEKMHTMIMQESKALTSEDGVTELDLTSDFADSVDELYKAINRVERQVREDNGYILQAMSSSELSDLYDMIKVMKHSITQMNHMISSTNAHRMDTVATKAIDYAKELGQTKMPEAVRRYDFGEALPYYTFKRMGEGGKIVFENFMDGQDKMAFHARTIKDYADSVYSAKQVNEWEKDVREFTVGDKTFEITVPQIMSLYCLSKRDQARQHILQGGIRVDEFKKGFKKVNQVENVNLSAADLSNIIGTLTDEQREVADKLQEFMNTVCSDWGNEVTMKRFGIKGFTEKNYFPIRSDENNLKSDTKDRQNSLYALLNMSFTKGLTANANNQIIVSDVFDVFAKHSSDMARYNALSLPVLDLIRWWNYKVRTENENGFSDVTVKGALENAFGREMNSYIRRFIDDVNGTKEKGRMDSLSSKMLTAYKVAAVGANIQVALLQPISYIRAAYVIDKKYLTQGFTRKPNTADAKQYVGMMVWKDMGFFEPDVTNGLQDIIKHADTAADKIKELSMKGAELGDTLTWGFLWNACEAEVADKRHDLVRGSEEFKKVVAKRMREVIYSTQVVDSVFTRSQYMRGGDMYAKMLTAFLAEPTLSLNVLRDAYEGYAQDVKRYGKGEAWKRNGRNISMAFGTYITCAVVESALRGAIGKVRDPEDDEEIGKLIMDNLKNELNPLGKLPYFKDIVELMEGYSPTRMDESVIQQGIWTYKAIVKGEWDYSTWYKIFKFASQVSGLPLSNAMREATTIWNASVGSFYPSIRIE